MLSERMTDRSSRMRIITMAVAFEGQPTDRRIRVHYGRRPAHRFESALVDETTTEITVAISLSSPRGPTRASRIGDAVDVALDAPLGKRRIIDRRTGRELPRMPNP
jgi:hypothetical protein